MGFWGSLFNPISSVSSLVPEVDSTYKKYTADIHNFTLEDQNMKNTSSVNKLDFQLNHIQDELNEINNIDDVKKHFQGK